MDSRDLARDAAARIIAERGIIGLRVEDVAAAAGVSTSLLYYHFGSRLGLIQAAFDYASERAPSTALRVQAADAGNGFQTLEAALLAEFDDDPGVRDFAIVWGDACASAVFDPALRATAQRITRDWRATLTTAINRGIADGSIRADTDPIASAEMLTALVDGLCVAWLTGSTGLSRARDLLRAALQQFRPPTTHEVPADGADTHVT